MSQHKILKNESNAHLNALAVTACLPVFKFTNIIDFCIKMKL